MVPFYTKLKAISIQSSFPLNHNIPVANNTTQSLTFVNIFGYSFTAKETAQEETKKQGSKLSQIIIHVRETMQSNWQEERVNAEMR